MRDHFVVLVERLITESTLEAAIESLERQDDVGSVAASSVDPNADFLPWKHSGDRGASGKLVECRICQEEDDDSNMEIPCYCCGSLKYAHRICVQRWCNEKGDTMCEICLHRFKPGYTSPPNLFRYGRIPMSFRGNWEISQRDIYNEQFVTMVRSNRDLVGTSGYDDSASSSTRSILYCRLAAAIFMILLSLCHALPTITSGSEQYSLALFMLFLLRTAGIVIPMYVILRAASTFLLLRFRQDFRELSIPTSEGENAYLQP
ncbi:uncharacterized protein M6B38_108160 [Iris pallida]|uniref:RING-CH-type domain-containing protein n=1 Tax=Iris pallida TaxID=29817 RepID=A0AAX6EGZ2_IRIPA|nr:uncharacterized protein M6B38_108160 [Iris pallida]